MLGLWPAHDKEISMQSLERVGIVEKTYVRASDLSGGQQQRLFVALALVNAPRLVFLDEMTTGLDPASRRVAWDLIRQIRDRGTTVVLVTHFMDEAVLRGMLETVIRHRERIDRSIVMPLSAPVRDCSSRS